MSNTRHIVLVKHDAGCPQGGPHSDAAKRVADTYNMHRVADPYGCIRKWIACALADGASDNTLYDSKQDAIRCQHNNENWYTFICIGPATMSVCAAEVMLNVARRVYDAGMRMTDGLAKNDVIKRLSWEDQLAQSRGLATNLIIEGNK